MIWPSRQMPNGTPLEALQPGDYARIQGRQFFVRPPQGEGAEVYALVHGDGKVSAVTRHWVLNHGEWSLRTP